MKIVRPATIDDTTLVSTTVPETDYSAWSAATAYSLGDRVIRTSLHKVYERIVAGTTATAPESDAVNWVEVSATNAWKMFDTSSSTVTTKSGSIVVEIEPGRVDAIALLEVSANTVTVEMATTAGTIYSHTETMTVREEITTTWSGYFFGAFAARNSLVLTDLPISAAATITVTIDGGAGVAECGTLVTGLAKEWGDLQLGVRAGIIDYSRKETDAFGNTTFVERTFAKRFEGQLIGPNTAVDSFYKFLAGIRATPSLWIGSEDYEALVVFGWYKDFSVDIAYPNYSSCSLTIEGLA